MANLFDSCTFRFPATPVGCCTVTLYTPRVPREPPTYSVLIPEFEKITGERSANTSGRRGALQVLAYVAEWLGLHALCNWARMVGPIG